MKYNTIYFNKIISFIYAISICFIFNIPSLKLGNYGIQQYLIVIPAIFMSIIWLIVKKNKLSKSIIILIMIVTAIFLSTSFKFGLHMTDFISFSGFLLIPLMVLAFNGINNKKNIIYYFVVLFTFLEIYVIYWILINNALFDVHKLVNLRILFNNWPNHFAMMSAIKFGLIKYLITKDQNKKLFAYSISSILTIFISLSRTGMLMLIIIYVTSHLIKNKTMNIKRSNYKRSLFILSLVVLIFGVNYTINSKNISPGATTSKTIEQRIRVWEEVLIVIKQNPILGIGFRSVANNTNTSLASTHNDFIDIILKSGFIGFVTIYGFYFKRLKNLYIYKEVDLVSIFIAILAAGFVQNPLKNISIMIIFALLLSLSYSKEIEIQ